MNVFDFALKMEMDGKDYYEKLSDEADNTGLKAIFTSLAADEQKHYETIQAVMSGAVWQMQDSTVQESAKNLFETLKDDKTISGSMRKSLDGYEHARKIEADSIRLYEDAAKKETNPSIKQILLRIAEEEKKHYNILDNLCDFTLTPQYFLAWREFSNIKEL